MKRIIVWVICLFLTAGSRISVSAKDKTDAMIHNIEQDVLFVGNVSHISDGYVVLKVTDYISTESTSDAIAKREKDHRYILMSKNGITYTSSYYGKQNAEEGDHVVASLKKKNGTWTVSNGLYEVDKDQYRTLSLEPVKKQLDISKLKLKYFINSDGTMKDFSTDQKQKKLYYKNQKIYDTRWNMKKYLTIEEIRNSEKLKAMDQRAHIKDETEKDQTTSVKRKLLFVADIFVIIGLVALLRKKYPKR